MPIDDRWRGTDQLSNLASAWSPLEIHAHHRMAELLHEAQQDRVASLARGVPTSGLQTGRYVALPTLLTAALPALEDFARRRVIHRPGHGVSEPKADDSPRRFKARTMLHQGRGSASEG